MDINHDSIPQRASVIGVFAHVDAGKTTLCEQLLYHADALRRPGRVDHQDAFLDYHRIERERGITVFSDQAVYKQDGALRFLLDTPGHVDFSGETARAMGVMDLGLFILSGVEGVQSHSETLFELADQNHLPLVCFINKMDREGADTDAVMAKLHRLNADCILFTGHTATGEMDEFLIEALAERDEALLEYYLESGYHAPVWQEALNRLVRKRRIIPVFAGSALKDQGISELLTALEDFLPKDGGAVSDTFGARVHKIHYDDKGCRLTDLKITSGSLSVRQMVGDDKILELRRYNGPRFTAISTARVGELCAVAGLTNSRAGDGLGCEPTQEENAFVPLFAAQTWATDGTDGPTLYQCMKQLGEEDPLLGVTWDAHAGQVLVYLMGPIQMEVLTQLVAERFGIAIAFGPARVVYQETIDAPVPGYGHFEPLRHYAEVCLHLEPGKRGSGITFESRCSQDILASNWQNLIRTHIFEQAHPGVLTGADLTDVRIVLTAGRAHLKHTEGGDFRQATCRAIRQGLMQAKAAGQVILLEPLWTFTLTLPTEQVGKVLSDITRMAGTLEEQQTLGTMTCITGVAPVAAMMDYPTVLMNDTHGRGMLRTHFTGYAPCHDAEAIITGAAYDPLSDGNHPCASIFCSHGAGYAVPWDEVSALMHCLK
ncbi:translation factor GTPase family protein [Eubacterium sp.]|uniref:translation factor GTPase family protein n=1 Tax=Eubacterium sp. TaxID=142586 RepID=UPI002FC5CB32